MNIIDKIAFSHFRPVEYRNEPVWKNYDRISSFIRGNFETPHHEILAKPFLTGAQVHWHTGLVGDFKPLDTLTLSQRQDALIRYHLFLQQVREKEVQLRQSGITDNLIWADLLSRVFNEKTNIIYVSGDSIALVWGFEYENQDENHIDPVVLQNHLQALQPAVIPVENGAQPGEHEQEVPDVDASLNAATDSVPGNREKRIYIRSNKSGRGGLYAYWWILLIPLILATLFLFYQSSDFFHGDSFSRNEALVRIIPSDPLRRPPLDTSKLVKGEDNASKIVSDLFNISLKDRAGNFEQFAIDLKKAFPDSAYRIVYFDTSTARLQFQFPDSNRAALKSEIRAKLTGYNLLIWDESIFSVSKTYNDPIFADTSRSWHLSLIGAPAAWDLTSGSPDVVLAVVDDGFDLSNPDLSSRIVKPYNVKERNSVVTSSDTRIHGTHVAGIALGKAGNGSGVAGVAPDCSFMPVQIARDGELFTSSDVIDGILYAIRNGADVINLSLGKYLPDELAGLSPAAQLELVNKLGRDEQDFWNELFAYADKEGVIIVMASGNQHMLTGIDPMQRSDKSIKVSAIDANMRPAGFSNYGSFSTVFAPGQSIYGIIPGNKEQFMDGTSMASPIVAGAAALLKSRKKDIRLSQVIDLIKKTGSPIKVEGQDAVVLRVDNMLKSL